MSDQPESGQVVLTTEEAAEILRVLAGFGGLLRAGVIEDWMVGGSSPEGDRSAGSSAFEKERGPGAAIRIADLIEELIQAIRRDLDRL